MNAGEHKTRLVMMLGALLLVGQACGPEPKKKFAALEGGSSARVKANATSAYQPRPSVSAAQLDTDSFAVTGLGVNLASTPTGNLLAISYLLPKLADFAQIVRCRRDVSIGTLGQVDVGQTSSEAAAARFLVTDYWGLAQSNPFCLVVSESFTKQGQVTFLDEFAPGGDYKYLVRACATASRITGAAQNGAKECSSWVALSDGFAGYRNARIEAEKSQFADVRKLRDQVDALGRQVYVAAEGVARELARCDSNWEKNKAAAAHREKLFGVLGQGIDLGQKLLGGTTSGADIGSSLAGIFASSKDYPISCYEAERHRRSGDAARLEMSLLLKQYPSKLKGVELPPAVPNETASAKVEAAAGNQTTTPVAPPQGGSKP